MRRQNRRLLAGVLVLSLLLLLLPPAGFGASAASDTVVEVYASGFNNPKGMAFAPDGTLYVAESGAPGDVMVPLPVNFGGEGPIGTNARISRVRPGGQREDVVTGLPNIGLYGGVEMLGAAGIAVLDGQLYEVAAGHISVSPRLSTFMDDGMLTMVADIGKFNDANPPPPTNGDAVPMGNPYDIIPLDGNLYITDGNYNRVLRVTPAGEISIAYAWENSPVTVGAAAGPDGDLYVCQFSPAPYTMGTGRIDRMTPDGQVTEGVVQNLTTPIDVAFAPDGTMYVLRYAAEFSPEKLRYIAFGGEVERVNPDGSTSPVVTNLVFPTAMTFGPDGALYVTNYGNESNKGEGQVLRVVPGDNPVKGPDVPPPDESGQYTNAQPTVTPATDLAPVATITIHEGADATQWGYDPAELTIQVGQAVEFVNGGRIAHTATARNGEFDTGLLQSGQSVVVQFNNPGDFDYFCQPHPWMQAKITVEGEAQGGTPVAGGGSTITLDPPSINFWAASAFVAAIIGVVFAGAYLMRRSSSPPVAAAGPAGPVAPPVPLEPVEPAPAAEPTPDPPAEGGPDDE